jgi:hypothetical protein
MVECSVVATNREGLTKGGTMKNIVVLDDKDHALKQAIYEFPNIEKNQLSFRHFDTISAFRSAKLTNIFILFLDLFLSKDKDYGHSDPRNRVSTLDLFQFDEANVRPHL